MMRRATAAVLVLALGAIFATVALDFREQTALAPLAEAYV